MTDTADKAPADYTNEPQQRMLDMIVLLAGNEFTGLLPSDIVAALKISAPMVTRDLWNLEKSGYAERVDQTGRWRLGPKLVRIGLAFTLHIDKQKSRLDELTHRYTRDI